MPVGGVVAVIGPNGSGKSTLFNAITGLVQAGSGSIRFEGADILGLRAAPTSWPRGVARTFQNIRLFPNLTVLENVLIGQHARLSTGPLGAVLRLAAHARRGDRGDATGRLDIIALFGNRLAPRAGQPVCGLSYANRRRVEIARALATRPRILLLDEPTAGMNPAETLELAEQIKSLHALGLTILLIEHKLDVVTRLADTVVVLDHGDKIAEGTPDEVRRDEEVLRAYLGRGGAGGGRCLTAGVTRSCEFQAVNTYYGDLHVLKNVNYTIGRGEIVSLLGGNACGKSTTMKTDHGRGAPDQRHGDVRRRRDPEHLPTSERVRRGIAPVLEARRLFPRMTIYENLEMGAYTRPQGRRSSARTSTASTRCSRG